MAPQGYLASMDGYMHRFSLINQDIDDKETIVDDTAIWSDDSKQNFFDVINFIETNYKAGLIFKFQFAQETVDFAGLEVSMDGVRPARKFL